MFPGGRTSISTTGGLSLAPFRTSGLKQLIISRCGITASGTPGVLDFSTLKAPPYDTEKALCIGYDMCTGFPILGLRIRISKTRMLRGTSSGC